MIHIDFSSKQVRAALSAVFSAKTYNRLASKIARMALAIMTSIKEVAQSSFAKRESKSGEVKEKSKTEGEMIDHTTLCEDVVPSLKTPQEKIYQKTVNCLGQVARQFKSMGDLTIESTKVIHDVVNSKSPHNIGLETLQQTHHLLHIKGDGNGCFNSLAFGLLHQLLNMASDRREKTVSELIDRVKLRIDALSRSQSPVVQDRAKSVKTTQSLQTIEHVLAQFAKPRQEEGNFNLLDWISDSSQNLPLIQALRHLTSLAGIDHHLNEGLELLESQLQKGIFGMQASGIADYLEKVSHCQSPNEQVFVGGFIEINGFAHLFDLQIHILNLTTIGDRRNQDLTPLEAVERGCTKSSPETPLTSFDPLFIVHGRFHYNAALIKDGSVSSPSMGENGPSTAPSDQSAHIAIADRTSEH